MRLKIRHYPPVSHLLLSSLNSELTLSLEFLENSLNPTTLYWIPGGLCNFFFYYQTLKVIVLYWPIVKAE